MQPFLEAIQNGASGDDIVALPLPDSYRAAVVRKDEVAMFEGMPSADKDPRKSLHVDDVAVPELAPDEAYVAVMASAINFNTVWTSIFEPLPTFGFLQRLGRESTWGARHDLPYHVVGSDASGAGIAAVGATSSFTSSRLRFDVSAASLCARPAASAPPPNSPAMKASRSACSSSTAGWGVKIDAI